MGELPSDISFYHILPRLPAESIIRFKSVSKQWHSFLTTREFAKMHIQHITNNNEDHKLIFISKTTPHMFRTLDCEATDNGLSTRRPLPFEAVYNKIYIISSVNGLVCVALMNGSCSEYTDIVIWNPVTSEHKILSKTNSHPECFDCFFGSFDLFHISSQDDYKLMCSTRSQNVYIYSLRNDSWRKVESKLLYDCGRPSTSTIYKDKLYFANFFESKVRTNRKQRYCSLKMIDLNTEELSQIATPPLGNIWNVDLTLMVIRGNLHVWKGICERSSSKTEMVLWRMDGDNGDWTKVFCYYPTQFLVNNWCMRPLHLMRNGLLLVDTKDNVYKVKVKKRTGDECRIYIPTNMELQPRSKFIATLVSPNQYVEPNP